jgi:putative acetyltransferase
MAESKAYRYSEREMITIRPETRLDLPAIRKINELAFGQVAEANLVDSLREYCRDLLSLLAIDDNEPVGHILFSPATIESEADTIRGMALAPMAVLPGRQRKGIGSALVREGLETLQHSSCPYIIVLGHPEFYPRFGFEPASRHGVKCQWEGVPDEAFMLAILDQDLMSGITGTARYRPEFDLA